MSDCSGGHLLVRQSRTRSIGDSYQKITEIRRKRHGYEQKAVSLKYKPYDLRCMRRDWRILKCGSYAGSVDLGPCGLLWSRRCGIFAGGSYYPPGSGKQLLKKTDISLVQKMF